MKFKRDDGWVLVVHASKRWSIIYFFLQLTLQSGMPIQNFVSYCLLSTLNNQMPESDINANIFSKYKINYLWKKMMNEGTEGEAI